MNKWNSNDLPPRQFPKRQYTKLTHKIGLVVILPLTILLIGGGIGVTCYHHQVHHTYQVAHKPTHKKFTNSEQVNHRSTIKKISTKQGEHLLGDWIRKLHYSTSKSQAILVNYQNQSKTKEFKGSQQLNRITYTSINDTKKKQQIRKFINAKF